MKFNKICLVFALSLSLGATQAAAAPQPAPLSSDTPASALPFSWDTLRAFVQKCAVQPYAQGRHGRKVLGTLRSVCPELSVSENRAEFVLQGQTYTAEIIDSTFSDGGDLNDLLITNVQGETLAKVSTILAFSDVILALALGDESFQHVEDER